MSKEKHIDDNSNDITEEYIIINKTALEKRIEDLRLLSNQPETSVYDVDVEGFVLEELEKLLSQSTPLVPEIEKAFDAGRISCFSSKSHDGSAEKQDYISNLKLDI